MCDTLEKAKQAEAKQELMIKRAEFERQIHALTETNIVFSDTSFNEELLAEWCPDAQCRRPSLNRS